MSSFFLQGPITLIITFSLSLARVRSLSLFDMWTVSWWWRQGVLDEQESEEDVVLTRSMPAFAFGKVVVC